LVDIAVRAGDPESRDSGYWYGPAGSPDSGGPREVLHALRVFQAADAAMRRRTRESMSMSENALLTIRYLLRQPTQDSTPGALARYLGISTAGTTSLLDSLQKSGHIERVANPHDRRSIRIRVTDRAHEEVRTTLSGMHRRMYEAVEGMSAEEVSAVLGFLRRMHDAVDAEPEADAGAV
jgi:DNA-binding MarR family transcriptional regulator